MKVHITDQQKSIIIDFIKKAFPKAQIKVFGSRIRGDHKPYSDIDICLDDKTPLILHKLSVLEENLSQSDIPFKVDIVDWNRITPDFQKLVSESFVPW